MLVKNILGGAWRKKQRNAITEDDDDDEENSEKLPSSFKRRNNSKNKGKENLDFSNFVVRLNEENEISEEDDEELQKNRESLSRRSLRHEMVRYI